MAALAYCSSDFETYIKVIIIMLYFVIIDRSFIMMIHIFVSQVCIRSCYNSVTSFVLLYQKCSYAAETCMYLGIAFKVICLRADIARWQQTKLYTQNLHARVYSIYSMCARADSRAESSSIYTFKSMRVCWHYKHCRYCGVDLHIIMAL